MSIQPSVLIQTDTNNTGWGAVIDKVSIGGPWLRSEEIYHINALELIAVNHAVKSFLQDKNNLQVLIQTDNITTMTYINKMGNHVKNLQQTSSGPLDMVLTEKHFESRFHPRSRKVDCGLGVETSLRPQQLETSHQNFQCFNESDNVLRHGPF